MQLFDPPSEMLIRQWNNAVTDPVRIKRIVTEHPETSRFEKIAGHLSALAPKLVITPEKHEQTLPGFLIRKNLVFSALPLEKELPPFLDTLSLLNKKESTLSKSILNTLDQLDIPVRLKLYIALQCPHCPHVVNTVIPLALYSDHIHLDIIDGTLFPEAAQKDKVLSAPCLILDHDFRWTGQVSAGEIAEMITGRDPSQLSMDTLKTILEQGDAAWITRQMVDRQKIFDAFIELLLHETWSVRLGAMVIVEELAGVAPDLAAQLCTPLTAVFTEKSIPVQGDILYALGEAGNTETIKWIQTLVPSLVHQDLTEAAQDALDTLESRHEQS